MAGAFRREFEPVDPVEEDDQFAEILGPSASTRAGSTASSSVVLARQAVPKRVASAFFAESREGDEPAPRRDVGCGEISLPFNRPSAAAPEDPPDQPGRTERGQYSQDQPDRFERLLVGQGSGPRFGRGGTRIRAASGSLTAHLGACCAARTARSGARSGRCRSSS